MNFLRLMMVILALNVNAHADEVFELKARFSATLIFASLPEAEVKRLIGRQDLQLDSSAREIANQYYPVPAGNYPVIFIQGTQSDMTDMNGNIFVASDRPLISYNESVFMLPRVQFNGKSYNYMPRLFLDRAIAVAVGRQKHGYDKLLGEFALDTAETRENAVTKYNGVVVADFKSDPSGVSPAPNLAPLFEKLVGEKFVSFSSSGGGAICTHQAVQVVKNSIYPIRASVQVNKGYFTDLGATIGAEGATPLYNFDGSNSSLKLLYDWKLAVPDIGCLQQP